MGIYLILPPNYRLKLTAPSFTHLAGVSRGQQTTTRPRPAALEYLDMATGLEDLKVPPSNRLHELQRERKGQYSISVNDQWRICFRFEDGDAYDVELTDYH